MFVAHFIGCALRAPRRSTFRIPLLENAARTRPRCLAVRGRDQMETGMRLTGGQMIADYLISEGVEYVFAVPGHGNTALLDAFVDRKREITVLPAMHEQGAAHMADGYYRASGKIAVVCTSIGPGATNTLTGVATAFADSMPIAADHRRGPYLHGGPRGSPGDRSPPRQQLPADGRAGRQAVVATQPAGSVPGDAQPRRSTPCSRAAAGPSCSISPRTCRPSSVSTRHRTRTGAGRLVASAATKRPSGARCRCWRAPNVL